MAFTFTSNFSVNRDQIIKAALRILRVIDPESGLGPTSIQVTNASETLNMMIKSLVTESLPLWSYVYYQIPMISGVKLYPIGPTAGYVYSTTITNAGSGGTPGTYALSFSGGGGTGATGTYTIGAGGTVTSISITAGGSSYTSAPTLSFPLGSVSGAAATATIVGYTGIRPLRILEAFVRDSNNRDIPQIPLAREEYNRLGIKTTATIQNQYYFDPQLGNANLYIFPVPTDNTRTFHASAQRQLYDLSSASDDLDFPQEFYNLLRWGLAFELAPEYEVDLQRVGFIKTIYEQYKEEAFSFNTETPATYFSPDPRGMRDA